MTRLESRVTETVKTATYVNHQAMTEKELHTYAGKFPMFNNQMYAATLALVVRRPSAIAVVHDDPERPWVHSKG